MNVGIYNLDNEDKGTYWKRYFPGTPVFDAYFDASPVENQHKLDLVCEQLEKLDDVLEITCPIWELKKEYKNLTFPMEATKFNETIVEYWSKFKNDKKWDHTSNK